MSSVSVDIFNDIKIAFIAFINGLNWAYIIMFGFVTYGIRNEPEFDWYNDLTKRSKLRIWIAGIIIMLTFCFFTYLENPKDLNAYYVSSILRSFMMTIILNRTVNGFLKTHIEKRAEELNNKKTNR